MERRIRNLKKSNEICGINELKRYNSYFYFKTTLLHKESTQVDIKKINISKKIR